MARVLAVLSLVGMLAATAVLGAPAAQAQDGDVTITILHNNDGESNLLPDEDGGDPGIARFVATLKDLQANAPGDGVVTLTSGDNFLASKEFSASLNNGTPFYDSIALSGLYDAMALGNHDFDFGPDVAASFVAGFDPAIPFLSANADFSAEPALQALVDSGAVAPSTVIETGGTQVGVIGAITRQRRGRKARGRRRQQDHPDQPPPRTVPGPGTRSATQRRRCCHRRWWR